MPENPQNSTQPPKGSPNDFTWKWHAKALAVIYGLLLIFYICLRIFLPK